MTQYADLRALQTLPPADVGVTAATATAGTSAAAGTDDVTTVTITNTSTTPTVAFFLRADVRRGTAAGTALPGDNEVLPITWSSNDITLWPGESETLTATYARPCCRDGPGGERVGLERGPGHLPGRRLTSGPVRAGGSGPRPAG